MLRLTSLLCSRGSCSAGGASTAAHRAVHFPPSESGHNLQETSLQPFSRQVSPTHVKFISAEFSLWNAPKLFYFVEISSSNSDVNTEFHKCRDAQFDEYLRNSVHSLILESEAGMIIVAVVRVRAQVNLQKKCATRCTNNGFNRIKPIGWVSLVKSVHFFGPKQLLPPR